MNQDQGGIRRHFNYSNVMSTLAVFMVIAGGTALAAKVKTDSVKSKSIKNGQVKLADLGSNSVDSSKVVDNSLGGADINESQLALPASPSALPPNGPAGGGLAGTYPNPTIAANAVNTAQIADNAVNSAKVAADSLTAADLEANSVTDSEVADGGLKNGDVATFTGASIFNFIDINPGACVNFPFPAVPGSGDTSNDVVVGGVDATDLTLGANTAGGATGPQGLQVTAQGSTVANQYRIVVCNNTSATVDPPNAEYFFSAFAR